MLSGVIHGFATPGSLAAAAGANSLDAKSGIWLITKLYHAAQQRSKPHHGGLVDAPCPRAQPPHDANRCEQDTDEERQGSEPKLALRLAQRRHNIAADIDEVAHIGGLQRGLELARPP